MELEGKKGDFDYAQSPKHLPENLRNPNGADRCLSGAEGTGRHTMKWELKIEKTLTVCFVVYSVTNSFSLSEIVKIL